MADNEHGKRDERTTDSAIEANMERSRHLNNVIGISAALRDKGYVLLAEQLDRAYVYFRDTASQSAPREHKQGCPALGGYGTADRECICAPSSTEPKPICYGIFNAKGQMHWSESCISPQREELAGELELLLDSEMPEGKEGWHIRPMYVAPFADSAKGEKDG